MLIRPKDFDALCQIFASVNCPMEVWAYGSRVNGTAHDASDLDLVIRTPDLTPLPIEVLTLLKEKIQGSTIPILVDLFDWSRLPESFHRNIESNYEVFFTNLGV